VAAGGKLQSGGGVAEEFVIDEDFGAVGIRGNSDCADAIGGGRWSDLRRLGGFSALACEKLACVLSGSLTRGGGEFFVERHGVGIEAMENFEKIRGAEGEAECESSVCGSRQGFFL